MAAARKYNDVYTGEHLDRVAFPLGGIGAGMVCLEGTGALSHVSVRNRPEVFNEPVTFSAIQIAGETKGETLVRVLEGPVPKWKAFGTPGAGNGLGGRTYGLPRLRSCSFAARFPFATIELRDEKVPLEVEITGWSPFTPPDPDPSSLPVAALEFRVCNPTGGTIEAVYSFHARNFMGTKPGGKPSGESVGEVDGGFVLRQEGTEGRPWDEGAFAAFVCEPDVKVNHTWFRGGWFDPLTQLWNELTRGEMPQRPPVVRGKDEDSPSPGGSLFVPFRLGPGAERAIRLMLVWYVPETDLHLGPKNDCCGAGGPSKRPELRDLPRHRPHYAGRFDSIEALAKHWRESCDELRGRSKRFSDCFYDTTLPAEVVEAIAANLTILKSPTVLRQTDGRLWCWEGCCDSSGCCMGSCTHVWNYQQAVPHLFPELERSLRETEFNESQDERGHQSFRSALPIRPTDHDFHAASDGQLGGLMKVHRDWRISGDTEWLKGLWPGVKQSLQYCIKTWDPEHKGILEEPHHNTYDIEFWGPDGMCSSFYLGALRAAALMAEALGEDAGPYEEILEKGREYLETKLFDGEYFFQDVRWEGLEAQFAPAGSPEEVELMRTEGPKYQYGTGCLADGVIGAYMAGACGVGGILDQGKVKSHLLAVHRYNLKHDLSEHANTQRPAFGLGDDGGLVLCTWPKGGKPSLPFPYCDEVWTGYEYQVAAHLMTIGCVEEGLDIVRAARDRYDGRVRNPFNEYECGHWYARAMSSYAMLGGLSGARYDAVDKVLYLAPNVKGDFRAFLSTASGFGTVGVKNGKPFVEVKEGEIDVGRIEHRPAES